MQKANGPPLERAGERASHDDDGGGDHEYGDEGGGGGAALQPAASAPSPNSFVAARIVALPNKALSLHCGALH